MTTTVYKQTYIIISMVPIQLTEIRTTYKNLCVVQGIINLKNYTMNSANTFVTLLMQ